MKAKVIAATLLATLLGAVGLQAQTPEEIIEKMSAELQRTDAEGFSMDFNMKLPLIGTVSSHNMVAGDKMKMVVSGEGKSSIIWTDSTTQWTYDKDAGEVTISAYKPSESDSDGSSLDTFSSINEGYDPVLQKETPQAWFILCKKSKTNKDKDDPKRIELAVSKATFLPIYMRTKKSLVTVSFENITIGVSEDSVTFKEEDCPGAKIIDKR